jgi:hypothetical protein
VAAPTRALLLLTALTLAGAAPSAQAQVLGGISVGPDGSIFVVRNYPDDVIFRVDPVTGAAAVVSSDTVGSGPPLLFPLNLASEASGSLVVTVPGFSQQKVLRIDPATGDRTVVSDASTGAGAPLYAPRGIAVAPDGALLVTEAVEDMSHPDDVVRVDPVTGDRAFVTSPSVGTGPLLGYPVSIAIEAGGGAVVTDLVLDAVVRVDLATGDRSVVSDAATGRGPVLRRAMAIAAAPDGRLLVAEVPIQPTFCLYLCPSEFCGLCLLPAPSLVSVDPVSGDRTRVSGGGSCLVFGISDCLTPFLGRKGRGPDFFEPTGVAVESGGSYVVADGLGPVVRVDAATGRRRVLADLHDAAPSIPRRRPLPDGGLAALWPFIWR